MIDKGRKHNKIIVSWLLKFRVHALLKSAVSKMNCIEPMWNSMWMFCSFPEIWSLELQKSLVEKECLSKILASIKSGCGGIKKRNARRVIFTACHSRKVKLAYTSQTSFQLAPKTFWWAELIPQFFCKLNSSKKRHLPIGQVKNRIH